MKYQITGSQGYIYLRHTPSGDIISYLVFQDPAHVHLAVKFHSKLQLIVNINIMPRQIMFVPRAASPLWTTIIHLTVLLK